METSINLVFIVSAAVLVLAFVAAFFSGQVYTGINAIEAENLHAKACLLFRTDCSADLYSVAVDGYSLADICIAKGISSSEACATSCGCFIAYDYPLASEKDRTTVTSNNFENIGVVTPE